MDSLKKADVKGKRVRVSDDSGCKFVGTVEYVDYQKGKLGITGTVEGSEGNAKSLQIFFRTDIKKIVVFDDNPAVYAKIPSISCRSETTDVTSKQPISSSNVLMPSGSEYRGGKYKNTTRKLQDNRGSAGETSDSSDRGKLSSTSQSPRSSTPEFSNIIVPSSDGTTPTKIGGRGYDVCARVSDSTLPPSHLLSLGRLKNASKDLKPRNTHVSFPSVRPNAPAAFSQSIDSSGYHCHIIPTVVTVPNLPVGPKEQEFARGVKEFLWDSVDTPPSFTTPSNLYFVEREGDLFKEAVVRLSTCLRIGISMEGQVLGRHGKSSLLVISSQEDVFVFDLNNMGVKAFKWGLYSILRNKEVVKVIHDSRQVSDTLYHQYDLELENVFDTLAGHVVFSNWLVKKDHKIAKPLDLAVRDYLGVPEEHLFSPRYSQSSLKADTSVWLARPLPHNLLVGASRNCMFLLSLGTIIERAIQLPMEMAVKELMSCSVKSDDVVARKMVLTPQYLPNEVQSSLPVWKQGSYQLRC